MDYDDLLEHHGIKGMKWGVRKDRETSDNHTRAKQVAVGVAILATVAATAYVAYKMKSSGRISASSLPKSPAGKEFAEKVLDEPTEVLHATRGKYRGSLFLNDKSLKEPLSLYDSGGFNDRHENAGEFVEHLASGHVAARITDLDGRRDFSGREITHELIIPKSMAHDAVTLDDVKTKIWPLLRMAMILCGNLDFIQIVKAFRRLIMALSNRAVPFYYAQFRDSVVRGDIPVNREVALEMNRIDALIDNPNVYYDDQAVEGFVLFCEHELTLTDGSDLYLLPSFKLWAEQVFGWYYFVERSVYEPSTDNHGGRYVNKTIKKRLTTKQYLIVARGAAKVHVRRVHSGLLPQL